MINKDKQKRHGFLIGLDEIFDTRFAVLEEINEDKAYDLLMEGYYSRERDDFPGVDIHDFRRRYKERDVRTLAHSKMTSLMLELRNIIGTYCVENTLEGKSDSVELILNIYPYKLDKEDVDMFVTCIKIHMGNIVPVRVINKPTRDISCEWLDDNVVAYYCYDWNEWMNTHQMEYIGKRMDGVGLIFPKVMPLSHAEGKKQVEDLEEEARVMEIFKEYEYDSTTFDIDEDDVFKTLTKTFRLCGANVDFYDTRLFSAMLPSDMPTPPGEFKYE